MARLLSPSRILIVDDHSMVREGLRLRIAAFPDLEVCGEVPRKTRPWSWSGKQIHN